MMCHRLLSFLASFVYFFSFNSRFCHDFFPRHFLAFFSFCSHIFSAFLIVLFLFFCLFVFLSLYSFKLRISCHDLFLARHTFRLRFDCQFFTGLVRFVLSSALPCHAVSFVALSLFLFSSFSFKTMIFLFLYSLLLLLLHFICVCTIVSPSSSLYRFSVVLVFVLFFVLSWYHVSVILLSFTPSVFFPSYFSCSKVCLLFLTHSVMPDSFLFVVNLSSVTYHRFGLDSILFLILSVNNNFFSAFALS